MTRNHSMAAIALLALACGDASAGPPLELIGTRLELPFEYRLIEKREHLSTGYGLGATRTYKIEVDRPNGEPQVLQVESAYYAPYRLEAGVVQNWMREEAEKAAAGDNVREVTPLQIDGFGFNFINAPNKDDKLRERMGITGVINGATLRVGIAAPDTGLLSEALAAALKKSRVDYASLLKLRAAFEEESKLAVQQEWLDTPLQRLELLKGETARLHSSVRVTDPAGNVILRRRGFNISKMGFWAAQFLSVYAGCGKESSLPAGEYQDYLGMKDELANEEPDKRYSNVSAPVADTLLGMPAQTATATGPKFNPMRNTQVTRTAARHGKDIYFVGVERLNGSAVEKSLLGQLRNGTPRCQLDLQFGSNGALPAEAAPPPAPGK